MGIIEWFDGGRGSMKWSLFGIQILATQDSSRGCTRQFEPKGGEKEQRQIPYRIRTWGLKGIDFGEVRSLLSVAKCNGLFDGACCGNEGLVLVGEGSVDRILARDDGLDRSGCLRRPMDNVLLVGPMTCLKHRDVTKLDRLRTRQRSPPVCLRRLHQSQPQSVILGLGFATL